MNKDESEYTCPIRFGDSTKGTVPSYGRIPTKAPRGYLTKRQERYAKIAYVACDPIIEEGKHSTDAYGNYLFHNRGNAIKVHTLEGRKYVSSKLI